MLAEEGFLLDDLTAEGAISFIETQRRDAGLAVAFENRLDAVCSDASGDTTEFEHGIVASIADLPVDDEAVTGERAVFGDAKIREGDVFRRGQAREELWFFLTEDIDDGSAGDATEFLVEPRNKDKGGRVDETVDGILGRACERKTAEITADGDACRFVEIDRSATAGGVDGDGENDAKD